MEQLAKVKKTGEEIRVHEFVDDVIEKGRILYESTGNVLYTPDELIFLKEDDIKPVDKEDSIWESRRFDLFKSLMAGLASNPATNVQEAPLEDAIDWALRVTDMAIECFKNKE